MGGKDFTKERIALFTKYFLEDGRPITVSQLMKKAKDYLGFMPKRQTVYDDLNTIDIVLGLEKENRAHSSGYGYAVYWSYSCKH